MSHLTHGMTCVLWVCSLVILKHVLARVFWLVVGVITWVSALNNVYFGV
jgi:hypothetical protein